MVTSLGMISIGQSGKCDSDRCRPKAPALADASGTLLDFFDVRQGGGLGGRVITKATFPDQGIGVHEQAALFAVMVPRNRLEAVSDEKC